MASALAIAIAEDEQNGFSDIRHSESSSALVENDINVCIEDRPVDKPRPSTSRYEADGSRDYSDFHANGTGEPLHVGRPKSFPHFIGYHPVKLFKIKSKLNSAEGISFLPNERVIAADNHGFIEIFDSDGKHVRTVVKSGKPCGITANRSGMFAFVDSKHKEKAIKVYTEDGGLISEFGMDNWKPFGITITNKGLLIVTDTSPKSQCVTMFTNAGKVMSKFGNHGEGKEELTEPLYVCVDTKDRILISDKSQCCVKVFSERGEFLGKFGHRGRGDGHLLNPRGLTEDAFGNILVCDTSNRRVSAFTHTGHFIKHILTSADGVTYPVDIAFDRQTGKLAVSMRGPNGNFHKIRVYQIPSLDEALQRVN